MDPDVPLVVSEVNPEAIHEARKGIIANPNCTTMAAMPVLKPLHDEAGLVRLVASTYQAVSGSGVAGVAELADQVEAAGDPRGLAFDGAAVTLPEPVKYARPIAFNVLPLAGLDRRRRLQRDRRGAEAPQRVPQDPRHPRPPGLGHLRPGAGLHRPLAVDQRRVRLRRSRPSGPSSCSPRPPASIVTDIPTPLQAAGQDPSYVGRVRQDQSVEGERGLVLFVSNDNLRKGAALNTVQIAELLVAP